MQYKYDLGDVVGFVTESWMTGVVLGREEKTFTFGKFAAYKVRRRNNVTGFFITEEFIEFELCDPAPMAKEEEAECWDEDFPEDYPEDEWGGQMHGH